jgi:drug/metabolite transporter (DMT)-like permease
MGSDEGKGILLAFLAALISGVSVFVNGAAVKLADPFVYTTLKNLGALAFIGAAVFAFSELRSFKGLSKRQWGMLIAIGVIGGSVPFLMFFWGLKLGGAAVSSFIFRSLFLFAGVAGYLVLKENPEPRDLAAGLILLVGNALLVSGDLAFGLGQMLVLGATILWAIEYSISRKMLAEVNPRVVMASRMAFGSIILLGFLSFEGTLGSVFQLSADMALWLVVTSVLLGGFLLSWYGSLKHLPVMRATAILALGGIITASLSIMQGGAVTLSESIGLLIILAGVGVAVGIAGFASTMRLVRGHLQRVMG